jgi:CHAT domain-containing protein/tetratricopeptide (TPR) repeat protein
MRLRISPPARRLFTLSLLCALAVAAGSCGAVQAAPGGTLVHELARAGAVRTGAARLSITTAYRPCRLRVPPAGTVPLAECPAQRDPPDRVLELAARAAATLRAGVDPDALHAAALVDLLWTDGAAGSVDDVVGRLQSAARLSPRPAPVLADLAAAHVERAARTQDPRDLLEALDAAARAVEADPHLPAARFNQALSLELLGLYAQARAAWAELAARDPRSRWGGEARRRARALASIPAPPAPPPPGAPVRDWRAFAAAPQAAQLHAWDRVLGAWGDAVLRGDAAAAAGRLAEAGELGAALEERGGDATVAAAVRAIRACAGDAARTRALARAHAQYAAGRAAYAAGDYVPSSPFFARAAAGAGASPALRGWAELFHAATVVYAGRPAEGEARLRQTAARADTARHPALAGRARWSLGTTLLRAGRYEQARGAFRGAARLLQRAGEREHLGAVQYLEAEAELALGDSRAGYAALHRALATLRPYPGSVWRHNVLGVTARAASAEGLTRAALRVQDEGVAAARGTGLTLYVAEAHLARARLLAAAGNPGTAAADVAAGRAAVATMEPGFKRNWFQAQVRLSEAALAAPANPRRAALALDSVVTFFEGVEAPFLLLPALIRRAEARLASGQASGAEADLNRATALLARMGTDLSGAESRAVFLEAGRGAFDRLVMLHASAGRHAEALLQLERSRASFSPSSPPVPSGVLPPVPAGQVALELALIGDTLMAWTAEGTRVRLARTVVDRAALAREVERARSALELGVDGASTRRVLSRLYEWLVRPVEGRLGARGTPVAIVADGEIAGVPFAALYDARRGRYLVEDHPLRFAATLADASRPPRKPPLHMAALLVADPAFDPGVRPALARLPGAAAEVRAVAAVYSGSRELAGAAAGPEALERMLPGADVVHYAGHAVFDNARPERSALVLAGGGALTAARLAELDLRRVRLVVLSACRTSGARDGRAGGFTGFSGALLSAGAGGVLGSLWRVDDERTRALMSAFHQAYRAHGGDATAALRAAQLRLLRSLDPALRSPVAWAGFRYAGR